LIRLYDRAKSSKSSTRIGEGLYLSAGYFADYEKLVCDVTQMDIKKYLYSKVSNTPPYATIKETPVEFIDRFIIIDEEVKDIEQNSSTSSTKPNIKGKK